MPKNDKYLAEATQYGACHYAPLPIPVVRGKDVWLWDADGRKYLDCLSAYSAVNQGHCHPRLVKVLTEQAQKLTLASSAVCNDQMGRAFKKIANFCGKDKALMMNSGAEAVETAIKVARKWGYTIKGVEPNRAEIITFNNNFHGRTTTIVSFSDCEQYKALFGPHTPGFKIVNFGDIESLRSAITKNTVAVLIEPIQGEGGIIIPSNGYLAAVRELCDEQNVLMIADEIQCGLGRVGLRFACDFECISPDIYILGKALSGGFYPISAIAADEDVMGVFSPGDHGSTYGANPLACALVCEALQILKDENLTYWSNVLGLYAMDKFRAIKSSRIKSIRGRGLLIGIELTSEAGPARSFCERLAKEGDIGLICKETHDHILRFAPPLVIRHPEIDFAVERIAEVFT